MKRVVIGGGGISGLSLAWALRGYGQSAQVLEASARAGGKLQSDRLDGYLVEYGPQSFDSKDDLAQSLVGALGLQGALVEATGSARRRCVLVDGELHEVPSSPRGLARSGIAGTRTKARLMLELALPRRAAALERDESVAEFARRRFGDLAAERFFFPIVSGLYAGDPELVSVLAAFPRFTALERDRRSVLTGTLSALRQARLASFREGMGTLPLALAEHLGPDLRQGVAIASLRRSGSGWRVGLLERGRQSEIEADVVALTLPAHAVGTVLEGVDTSLSAIVGRISYAPVVMVHLGYRRDSLPRLPHAYGYYAPASEPSRLLGAVFTSEIFPGHAPPGHALVSCRMGGAREPDLLAKADGELAAIAHRELERVLGATAPPVFQKVGRHPLALPQYTLGHLERVAAIDAAVGRHSGLFLAGNAYHGLGILDCLRQADALAIRIASHLSWPFSSDHQPLAIRTRV